MTKLPVITQELARDIWNTSNIEIKREMLSSFIKEEFNTIEQGKIRLHLSRAKTAANIDFLVSNMLLKTEKIGVI